MQKKVFLGQLEAENSETIVSATAKLISSPS